MKKYDSEAEAARARSERPTIPAPPPARAASGPVLRKRPESGRSLRQAVILLTQKLEAMGIDCSDVTEMLGDVE